ncbi:hypothetical protein Droror1_Dr00010155 [Drosera rotundifolia]
MSSCELCVHEVWEIDLVGMVRSLVRGGFVVIWSESNEGSGRIQSFRSISFHCRIIDSSTFSPSPQIPPNPWNRDSDNNSASKFESMAIDDDTESCSNRAIAVAESSPATVAPRAAKHQMLKHDVYNDVLRRLQEGEFEEASVIGFEDQLWQHFNRLPARSLID